ncbi:hypothetical protein FQR65_LT13629 [Abscondita terminalis]|nr:hypothetical protein FQR65_LT13629 [Abscondita terminalis]
MTKLGGEVLAHPQPGEEVVVTGMAGRFPESDNIDLYLKNICAKKDMITCDNRRWLPTNPEVPHRLGKINFIEKLDAGYFGTHYMQSNQMDPMLREVLERSYEVFVDAGLNVAELRGSKIGVFIGACFSETEEALVYEFCKTPDFGITGSTRSMLAQQVSYTFGLQGPSHTVDTACSSSLYAVEHGYRAIRQGKCDAALVGGASLCLNPQMSLQFYRLGVLSDDGTCKAFDEAADGYARSESVALVLLQKAKDARRIYARLVHAKTNSDGYKEQGITFPSSQMQKVLVQDFYNDCKIDPITVDFLEAHATGTSVGDPEEMTAMDEVFCTGRKGPLYIGSIKSYLGHAEGGSGMCSVVKILLGMENDCLLPNIHFKTPRQSIRGLVEGRMVVVTDTIPWPKDGSGLVAVNSFGFGGSNGHALFKRYNKAKVGGGVPSDDLPRLVCVSGRTEKSLHTIFDDVSKRKLDAEYVRLLQQVFKNSSSEHSYRGFIIQSKGGEVSRYASFYDGKRKPLGLVVCGGGKDLSAIAKDLTRIPIFAKDRSFQVALIDLFTKVGVHFDWVSDKRNNFSPNVTIVAVGKNTGFSTLEVHGVESLLHVLGSLYTMGYSVDCEHLAPEVEWPVSAGTPTISNLVEWNHNENWQTFIHAQRKTSPLGVRNLTLLNKEIDWSFLPGHVIDGMLLMPATGYIFMVWETFCKTFNYGLAASKLIFEDVKFHTATQIAKNSSIVFKITITRETHRFEIGDGEQLIVSGKIYVMEDLEDEFAMQPQLEAASNDSICLTTKDFYKELKLRGYNYSGAFCSVQKADLSGKTTWIKWDRIWITFMDNMLQTKLLQEDTRNLYVPTYIERLVVDAPRHTEFGNKYENHPAVPVFNRKECNSIISGGIEIRGLQASAIPRRKARGEPVLETYKFVPLRGARLSLEDAARVFTQIFLENALVLKVNVVEVVKNDAVEVMAHEIKRALDDHPLIKSDVSVFSSKIMEVPGVKVVVDKVLDGETQYSIVVIAEPHGMVGASLKTNGFVIVRETLGGCDVQLPGFEVVSEIITDKEKLKLLKKVTQTGAGKVLKIVLDGSNFEWIPALQEAMKNDNKVTLVIEGEDFSGALGFFNCIRREPGGAQLRCVFLMDRNVRFDERFLTDTPLAVNVMKGGVWGTYRHLPLNVDVVVQREQMFNCITQIGNLSSLRWLEGPLTSDTVMEPESTMVKVCYSAINFKDLTIASGRIGTDAFTRNRLDQLQSHAQGFEFSGYDTRGRRVMGMLCNGGSLTTLLKADPSMMVQIPDCWTLEESATVIVTYSTVLCSLISVSYFLGIAHFFGFCFQCGRIKTGQSVLIHAGSGGIGQAALHIATYFKCNIFTTVSTEEKRQFIRKHFPNVPEENIGNSRDTSFERMIYKRTGGKGVDIVLNSLVDEKLQASVRCLAPHGKFVEIGKYDLVKNNALPLTSFTEGRGYYGAMLDLFFYYPPTVKTPLVKLLQKYVDLGAVKPLHRVVFGYDEVEQAYRYMAAGKHMGKLLIRVRDEEIVERQLFPGAPRFKCDSDKAYVIVGGLGGFGLELVDWLVVRGARKLMLVSRSGVKNGYAATRINVWKSYQVIVAVSTDDVTTVDGCRSLLNKAAKLGPVVAIFNLAVVLRDGLFENQTEENFVTSLGPKAMATRNLDVVSREMCPNLRHFVVFSSVSCGRGNPGQTNYGMANSIMERVCERRKDDGYPALAIQWGAIGEVGLVAEMQELQREIEIGGTLQQRVAACLTVLDNFLMQDEPIVASMVVAEKRTSADGAAGIIDVIKNIMGITDLKTISEHATLPELGMDSMSALEIKQTLERECEVFLNAKEIRTLTFAKLKEVLDTKMVETEGEVVLEKLNMLHRTMISDDEAIIPFRRLHTMIKDDEDAPTVLVLPGIEGVASGMASLTCNFKAHALCLQYVYDNTDEETIESLAEAVLKHVPDEQTFFLVAYSYGCVVGMQLVALLEARGRIGTVVFIDGGLEVFKEVMEQQFPGCESPPVLDTVILSHIMQMHMPAEAVNIHKEALMKANTLDERVKYVLSVAPKDVLQAVRYHKEVFYKSCYRLRALFAYRPNFPKFKSSVMLLKPSQPLIDNYDEDYRIGRFCANEVGVHVFEGNHVSILNNLNLVNHINNLINQVSNKV